ncbi:Peptidase S8, subtilisin-related protein [Metarhizium guizhouense ARSEF 977]|uniref:Peptidase S8, subtilisin-related protein n=1 Tax=Metarhizium guizhouense (strain ARSEF 977) TaxID=1276136 RepID=A0A0B4GXF8_METGA|nr:Peptidase S8, subtilisin-related protein [Metarhizium guizhouense ARSEF 977]
MKPRRALSGLLFSTCLAARLPTIPSPDNNQVASIDVDVKGSRDTLTSQQNAPGNLVRLSHYQTENVQTYEYDGSAGQGITVYVLDGGIRLTHEEFGGRATFGAGFAFHQGEGDSDGHGTHVAAIIGGAKYGVAKQVQIVSVKLQPKKPQLEKALDFVLKDAQDKNITGKAIISMSMSFLASDDIDKMFKRVVDSGIVCVVSAGNDNSDASIASPGRDPSVITVAAMNHRSDSRWEESNYGPAVDLYAPGADITSASRDSDSASVTLGGTSQAAPHVAGLAAYIMSLEGITQPSQVAARLKDIAEQSGARVQWNAPDTTGLIASNGLDKGGPSSLFPPKKIPWTPEPKKSGECGDPEYSERKCGSQKYCNAFDAAPQEPKTGFFKNAKECFDAHEPAPKLPWIKAPNPKTGPGSCGHSATGNPAWAIYNDAICGTQVYCEAFDKIKPRPDFLFGFKDTKACLEAHEPPPSG